MAGTSITDSENLVLDETTNVGIEVTTNNTCQKVVPPLVPVQLK